MIKMTAIGFLNGVDPVEADRWYFRYHSKECVRFFGPWLRRYESYRALATPAEAGPWGVRGGRLTELWYDSPESFVEAKPFERPYTPASFTRVTQALPSLATIVPAMPTEDFLGKEPTPEGGPVLRWVWIFRYPRGVDQAEGEKWFLETHAQEIGNQEGLLRFVSHQAVDPPLMPGPFQYPRVCELWYEDLDAWRKAVIEDPPDYTPPPWGDGEPFLEIGSTLVGYKPDVDFLRDDPVVP